MNRLLLLLLVACQTIIYSGCSDRQPPPKPQTTIEADTQASSDTSEKPSSDTSEKPSSDTLHGIEIQLATFVTFDQLYREILDGNAKKWEKQSITVIAEVVSKDKHDRSVSTILWNDSNSRFMCHVNSKDKLNMAGLDLLFMPKLARYENAFDKCEIGETYIFQLTIRKISAYNDERIVLIYCDLTDDTFTKDDPYTIEREESDAKLIFSVITVDILESLVDDFLMKPSLQEEMLDQWFIRLTGTVAEKREHSIELRTYDEMFSFIIYVSSLNNTIDTYQVGEEYTFYVNEGSVHTHRIGKSELSVKFMIFHTITPTSLSLSDTKKKLEH